MFYSRLSDIFSRHFGTRLILPLFAVLLLCSCELLIRHPRFKVSFHETVPDTLYSNAQSSLMVRVRSLDGKTERRVRSFAVIDSAHIVKIDVLRHQDGQHAALKIYFDEFGPGIWSEVHAYHPAAEIAVVVDGFLSGYMRLPEQLEEGNTITTPPLWTLAEARLIAENAHRNYKVINNIWFD